SSQVELVAVSIVRLERFPNRPAGGWHDGVSVGDCLHSFCHWQPGRLTGFLEGGDLGRDYVHQCVPGFGEGLCTILLEPPSQLIDIDTCLGEFRQHLLTVAAIRRQDRAEVVVLGEGSRRGRWHSVYGERGCQ